MKVVLISGHAADSDRKTGFHFWAKILSKRGVDVDFITVGSSPISLLKKGGKQLKPPYNKWVPIDKRINRFTWLPIFHPLNFNNKFLDYLSFPLFSLYPLLLPRSLKDKIKCADYFIIESGAGIMIVSALRKLCPDAKFIYNYSDRRGVVQFHPIIPYTEKKVLHHFDMIRLNSSDTADEFPANAPTEYIPQAIDKTLFDEASSNPYTTSKNAISVGDMLFDAASIRDLATHFPDWHFHLFGKGAKIGEPALPNVIEYGEMPFQELVQYIKYADIGLAPYAHVPNAAYLSQSSLKLVQYTYCQLPIVAPDFAVTGRSHARGYTQTSGPVSAFNEAIAIDRRTIEKQQVMGWEEMIDKMMKRAAN